MKRGLGKLRNSTGWLSSASLRKADFQASYFFLRVKPKIARVVLVTPANNVHYSFDYLR